MKKRTRWIGFALLTAAVGLATVAVGQRAARKAPTAEDWTALAKLPDLTGVWEIGLGRGAGRAQAKGPAPAATARGGPGRAAGPSLTPAYAAKAPETQRFTANCLPPGLPGIMGQPYPMEFLLTPGQVTIVIEAYNQIRHIYTDGRPLPEDPDPTFYGTSVGHWEGDTLVAETVGFADVPRGLTFPYSDKMKIVERFRLTAPDTMSIETTIVDPEALTAPYSMGSRTLTRHRNWTIAEYICEENNRNYVDANGKEGVNLAKPNASAR